MSQPSVNAAVVEIELLDGRRVVLTPTLRAAQTVNRRCGSLRDALQAVAGLNLDAYKEVICAGAKWSESEWKAHEDALFALGYAKLTGPLAEFMTLLLTGGKRAAEPEAEKPGGN